MRKYPKLSIVTPCYNMEETIEETIESVISQQYPNLEYIIVDGASTDGTMKIIERYKDYISLIISEPDNGMYDAINKGFSHATGEIFAWINADDAYMPWAFKAVGNLFSDYPQVSWAIGMPTYMTGERIPNKFFNFCNAYCRKDIARGWHRRNVFSFLQQESMFWRRELWEKVHGLNTHYKLAGDFDLWIRFAQHAELTTMALPISAFYKSDNTLSNTTNKGINLYDKEVENICKKIGSGYPSFILRWWGKYPVVNYMYRILRWKKSPLYYYSFSSKKWLYVQVRRSMCNITLSDLFLELKFK